ncbi:hypothetical protein [Kingella oralis]|nr:hypothetical protein [Kingella oralis]
MRGDCSASDLFSGCFVNVFRMGSLKRGLAQPSSVQFVFRLP